MGRLFLRLLVSAGLLLTIGCAGYVTPNAMHLRDSQCTLTVSKKIKVAMDDNEIFRVGVQFRGEKTPVTLAVDVCYLKDRAHDDLFVAQDSFNLDALAPMVGIDYAF